MRLRARFTLAFGALLLALLVLTAWLSYNTFLQIMVKEQEGELRMRGLLWIKLAQRMKGEDVQYLRSIPLRSGNMEVVLYEPETKRVIFSSLAAGDTEEWLAKQIKPTAKRWWRISDRPRDKYVTESFEFKVNEEERMLVLGTTLKGIKQANFHILRQMLIVLFIGGGLVIALSYYLTKRLTKPLSSLQTELQKVEKRQFANVHRVKADGELGEVAEGVYRMAKQVETYIIIQKQFFQNASHELKTPLQSIQGYAEGIRDGVFTGERSEQGLSVIVSETERLKRIVTEMTLLAKLESEEGIFRETRVHLLEMAEGMIQRLQPLGEEKGIQLVIGNHIPKGAGQIVADPEKLMQAFLNIGGNAIRYASEKVTLRMSTEKGETIVEIQDDGPGIDENIFPRLFQRFAKGAGGDTGLGLAISKAIVERTGGSIEAENSPQGGAIFTMRFPLG
jgi:signal transduction histidine kinase